MIRKNWLIPLLAVACVLGSNLPSQAQDPAFGFLYGYGLGQAQRFRTNLPTPPYFSIYPPVYYGRRYERPYGDSPFASWPTLQANAEYRATPKQEVSQEVMNPHTCPAESVTPQVAHQPAIGKRVVIENPYVVQPSDDRLYTAAAK